SDLTTVATPSRWTTWFDASRRCYRGRHDHVRPSQAEASLRRAVHRRAGDRARAARARRPALPARAREGAGGAHGYARLDRHRLRAWLPRAPARAVLPLPRGRRARPADLGARVP